MLLMLTTDPRLPVVDEIAWAAAHGFGGVELALGAPAAAPEADIWPAARGALAVAGLAVVVRAPGYLCVENPAPAIRQAALDELRRCADVAAALGAPVLSTPFRGWPAHLPDAVGYEYTKQLYEILLRHAAGQGVAVALENSADNAHQIKRFREVFHRLPGLRLHYNIGRGHVGTAQSLTREYLFALSDRLAHVSLSDNDGQRDDRLPLGAAVDGVSVLRELQTLRSFRYDGRLALDVAGDHRWAAASAEIVAELWPQAA